MSHNIMKELVRNFCFKNGDFTLSSGKKSSYYINIKNVYSFSDLFSLLADEIIKKINSDFDCVAGVPYGSLPLASIVAIKLKKPLLLLRKEVKGYGVEDVSNEYKTCLLIEDVVTTGASVKNAIKSLILNGNIQVTQVISVVDREEEKMLYKHTPIYKISDFYKTRLEYKLSKLGCYSLMKIVQSKKSNIIFSCDTSSFNEACKIIEKIGILVAGVKIHSDIWTDFNSVKLKLLATKYNFIIIEDRKLADIGKIVKEQCKIISKYADMITLHGIPGEGILEAIKDMSLIPIIIREMSSKNLITTEYKNRIDEMIQKYNVKAIIGQSEHDKLVFTPGVNMLKKGDNLGQQYNTPESVIDKGADFIIVGTDIYSSDNPYRVVLKYIDICNVAMEKTRPIRLSKL